MDNIHYLSVSYKKNSSLAKLYLFFATTALILFYYAHAEWIGVEKLFYVPCGLALIISFMLHSKQDTINVILYIFIIVSILSDIIFGVIPTDFLTSNATRFILGILCFYKLRDFNLNYIIKYLTYLTPIIISTYYIFDNPIALRGIGRYGGFSGDPNYLAISLNLLATINLLYFKVTNNFYIRILIICSLLAMFPIFIAGQSRIGSVSFFIILICATINLYHTSKIAFAVLCTIFFFVFTYFCANNADIIMGFISRFDGSNKVDVGAATARFDQIEGCIAILKEYPYLIICGIGIDASPLDYTVYRIISHNVVHNTYFSIIIHQGLIAFIFFVAFLWKAFIIVLKSKNIILIGFFISLILNIASVSSITYLTFWWSMFFLLNPSIKNGNSNSLYLHRAL